MGHINKRILIVHDWILDLRGGERCLDAFLKLYPNADVATLLHRKGSATCRIDSSVKYVSCLQKLPLACNYHRLLLPLFGLGVRSLSRITSEYDVIISLSHACAKNIRKENPSTVHLSYCFTPMRYIWDQRKAYLGAFETVVRPYIKLLRKWDKEGAAGVDYFIAISRFVSKRIKRFYNRKAEVIYPPVSFDWLYGNPENSKREDFFLYAGALVPYKNVDVLIKAFNVLGAKLVIAGTGPEENRLKALAGKNVRFLGRVSDARLRELYYKAKALIFPVVEDFGMIPIEAMYCGLPVIGNRAGALLETHKGIGGGRAVEEDLDEKRCCTGVFIEPPFDAQSIINAVKLFESKGDIYDREYLRKHAETYGYKNFYKSWCSYLEKNGLRNILPTSKESLSKGVLTG